MNFITEFFKKREAKAKAKAMQDLLETLKDPKNDKPNQSKSQIGEVSDGPWFKGANTWEHLAKAFIRIELPKSYPDYHGLAQKIENFSAAERHGAWIRVAQELTNKTDKIRCYLEALYNDPDPSSVARDWLNGKYDPAMNILDPHGHKTLKMVEELRFKHKPIIQKDFGDVGN